MKPEINREHGGCAFPGAQAKVKWPVSQRASTHIGTGCFPGQAPPKLSPCLPPTSSPALLRLHSLRPLGKLLVAESWLWGWGVGELVVTWEQPGPILGQPGTWGDCTQDTESCSATLPRRAPGHLEKTIVFESPPGPFIPDIFEHPDVGLGEAVTCPF